MLQWEHWAFGETVLTIPSLATHFTMTPSIDHIKIQEVPMTNQAILFDLDGTLLPMDNDRFTQGYFHLLAQAVAPYGYEEESLVSALWKGVGAMVRNQGLRPNCQVFWETFSQSLTHFKPGNFRRPNPSQVPILQRPRRLPWPGPRQSG